VRDLIAFWIGMAVGGAQTALNHWPWWVEPVTSVLCIGLVTAGRAVLLRRRRP
jgi:hypothetical protein